jgi:hypothetical protein
MFVAPQLDTADRLIRMVGYPTIVSVIVWAVRKWDAGRSEFLKVAEGVEQVKSDLVTMKTNHLAHLQDGINEVAKSNNEAVAVLKEIRSDIKESNQNTMLLLDRIPR